MAESMRGMRLGIQSLESDRGVELSERQTIDFRCSAGHEFSMVFSLTAELPDTWSARSAMRLQHVWSQARKSIWGIAS